MSKQLEKELTEARANAFIAIRQAEESIQIKDACVRRVDELEKKLKEGE